MTDASVWNVLPWIIAAGIVVYATAIAALRKTYPTKYIFWLLSLCAAVAVIGACYPRMLGIVVICDCVALGLLLIDQITVLPNVDIRAARTMQQTGSLGKPHDVKITVDNFSKRNWRIDVRDDCPLVLQPTPDTETFNLPARKTVEYEYQMRPQRRGSFEMQFIYLRRYSWLRFWSNYIKIEAPGRFNVYPDMQQLGKYAILARTDRLSLIGVRKTRRIGQDNYFERLRDYNQDDNFKHIDWRSTARRNKLTVRQFQSDQSQRVMFMLDCGRMMTNEHQRLSFVDHALNAMLMLSYVALKQGDSVGMLAFSDRIHSYVPVRGGRSQMNRLLHAGFDRFAELVPSRFDDAFMHLGSNCRRRTMVFLITNVIDEVSATEVTGHLSHLAKRHLPVVVLLRDSRIFTSADNPAEDESVLYQSAAAAQILLWRAELIRRMQFNGVLAIDAFPDDLTSPMVNQYLQAKAKHQL